MITRKRELVKLSSQFVMYSIISLLTCMVLFHMALLGFPILGFMWTFFWFTVFQAITLIEIKKKYKIETAVLVMVYGYLVIIAVLFSDGLKEKSKYFFIGLFFIVSLLSVISTIVLIKKMVDEYFPQILKLIKREHSSEEKD